MPYHVKSVPGHLIAFLRWPVFGGLLAACFLQLFAAFAPTIKPETVGVPDLIPPLNTAILALLWWRISQLEKLSDYFRDRMDKMGDHADERDDREHRPRARR